MGHRTAQAVRCITNCNQGKQHQRWRLQRKPDGYSHSGTSGAFGEIAHLHQYVDSGLLANGRKNGTHEQRGKQALAPWRPKRQLDNAERKSRYPWRLQNAANELIGSLFLSIKKPRFGGFTRRHGVALLLVFAFGCGVFRFSGFPVFSLFGIKHLKCQTISACTVVQRLRHAGDGCRRGTGCPFDNSV